MPRRSNHDAIREAAERHVDANEPIWWVWLDEPPERVLCQRGVHDINVIGALVCNRIDFRVLETDREDVSVVVSDVPMCVITMPEGFMRGFVGCMRANHLKGRYRKSGTEQEYRF